MEFDLIVIGSGPGGQKAALQAAKAGKKVALIEKNPDLGGNCVHSGTLPSKSFRESIYRWSMRASGTLGKEVNFQAEDAESDDSSVRFPDMQRLLRRTNRVIAVESEISQTQLKRNGVKLIVGHARFISANEIEVENGANKRRVKSNRVIIAVGSRPRNVDHLPIDGKYIFDSDNLLCLDRVPKSLAVLGGGVIACEYASMFMMACSKVFLIDRHDEILPFVDKKTADHLLERFEYYGMEMLYQAEAKSALIDQNSKTVHLELSDGSSLEVEAVLVSFGRVGNTNDLGLDKIGITPKNGLIEVDKQFQTQVKGVYAVGDVIGFPALASTSMEQGRIACCNALELTSNTSTEMNPLYPYGIYTIPEVSMVGKTEQELVKAKVDFITGEGHYREVARGQIIGDRWGLLRLHVDRSTRKLLGVHIAGDNAADLIHIGQAVMMFDGTVDYFIRTVFNYPTLAEAYKVAAYNAINQLGSKK